MFNGDERDMIDNMEESRIAYDHWIVVHVRVQTYSYRHFGRI